MKNIDNSILLDYAECSTCGKRIFIRGEWGYTSKNKFFCSYSCLRSYQKIAEQKNQSAESSCNQRRYMRNVETGEILALYQVAQKEDTTYSSVYNQYKKGARFRKVWVPFTVEQ